MKVGKEKTFMNNKTSLYKELLYSIVISKIAGGSIMKIYNLDSSEFDIRFKGDSSPLTIADEKSHNIIVKILKENFNYPILSEEGKNINFAIRKNWDCFWLIDPLDGTKEFIKKNDEFTINIALINDTKPILGIIYLPVKDIFYFAIKDFGSYKLENYRNLAGKLMNINSLEEAISLLKQSSIKISVNNKRDSNCPIKVVASRSHMSKKTKDFINKLKLQYEEVEVIQAGSSLKLCMVAEGKANIYPRFGPTMEWDTSASQIILEEAGGELIDCNMYIPLKYNKDNLVNPSFIAKDNCIDI